MTCNDKKNVIFQFECLINIDIYLIDAGSGTMNVQAIGSFKDLFCLL